MSPDAPKPSGQPSPTQPLASVLAPTQTPAISAIPQPETQFQSIKPAFDVWKLIWKLVIGLNFVVAFVFVLFVVLKLVGISSNEFQAGALGAPFWLLPALLLCELAVAAVYGFMKRPKLSEVTTILMWLGIGLGVAFVCAIAFVVYASVS